MAEQSGDEVSLAHALLARHRSCWGPHSPHERLKIANELSAVAERAAVRRLRPLATLFRITSLLELARVGDVDTEIQRMVGLAEELRDPYTQWQVLLLRSTRALMEGRFEDARSLGEDFLARGNRVGDENAPHSFGAQLAIQLWESDRVEDTVRACREFVRDFPHVPVWRASLMFFLVEADRLDEARREFMTLTARGLGDIVQDENWRATLMLIGDVAATIGKLEIAEQVYEELQVFHGTMVLSAHAVVVAGLQDHRLGILAAALGRFEAAARHFEHALALGKKAGAIPWLAHAQYSYAKMLLKQGSRANRSYAQELITCAGEITRAFGMVRLQKRVSALS